MKVERAGEIKELVVPLTYDPNSKREMLGVLPEYSIEKFTMLEASKLSLKSGVKIVTDTLSGLKMIVTGKVKSEEISGPIGIIKVVGEASKEGASIVFWLMALLSVNVGVLNLLPLPALDICIFILFVIVGIIVYYRDICLNKKIEERVHMVGMLILFGFIIFITTNDIFNLTK